MKRITDYKETNYDPTLKKSVKQGINHIFPKKQIILDFFL